MLLCKNIVDAAIEKEKQMHRDEAIQEVDIKNNCKKFEHRKEFDYNINLTFYTMITVN